MEFSFVLCGFVCFFESGKVVLALNLKNQTVSIDIMRDINNSCEAESSPEGCQYMFAALRKQINVIVFGDHTNVIFPTGKYLFD